MNIHRMMAGVYSANCYLVYSGDRGFIIDPGGEGEKISDEAEKLGFKPEFILLTHGHGDHIGAVNWLKDHYGIPVFAHKDEAKLLEDPDMNLSSTMVGGSHSVIVNRLLEDGEIIEPGVFDVEVIHTPGHSKGSVLYRIGNSLITGDTLFLGSVGRTDLVGSSSADMLNSLQTKILPLDDGLEIFPGHGPSSNMAYEKVNNPFLIDAKRDL